MRVPHGELRGVSVSAIIALGEVLGVLKCIDQERRLQLCQLLIVTSLLRKGFASGEHGILFVMREIQKEIVEGKDSRKEIGYNSRPSFLPKMK